MGAWTEALWARYDGLSQQSLSMNTVFDNRPSSELSDLEIVAYLFQSLRAQDMKTAGQVQDECKRLFPDLEVERMKDCMVMLAEKLDDGTPRVRARSRLRS